jgi:hypothetical protein
MYDPKKRFSAVFDSYVFLLLRRIKWPGDSPWVTYRINTRPGNLIRQSHARVTIVTFGEMA